MAIGSPLGYENSVTLGIVSGLSREIEGLTGTESAAYTNLIQTDAPISPGNSGGALANASGQVIGINVAYEPPSQTGAVSIGFAIPAATVTNVADQIINSGKVIQGYLGVSLFPDALTADIQKQYSLTRDSGVLIAEVVAGGPAAKAGLLQGDIIYKVGGKDVTDPSAFIALVRDMKPGIAGRGDRRSQGYGRDHHRDHRGTADFHVDHAPVSGYSGARRCVDAAAGRTGSCTRLNPSGRPPVRSHR